MWRWAILITAVLGVACAGGSGGAPLFAPAREQGDSAIDTLAVFEASEGRENVYARKLPGRDPEEVRRVLVREDARPARWRATDTGGNWLLFVDDGAGTIAMESGFYTGREGLLEFDPPLALFPPRLARGEAFATESRWRARAAGAERAGVLRGSVEYIGREDASVPAGDFAGTARVEASFEVRLPLGLEVSIRQTQWVDEGIGEVRRVVDGSFGLPKVPIRRFGSEHVLVETRTLSPEERAAWLGDFRAPPEGTAPRGDGG